MQKTLAKEYIESVAKALLETSPREVIEFKTVLNAHPQGNETHAGINEVISRIFTDPLLTELLSIVGIESEEKTVQEPILASLLASQISTQQLSKQIREQVAKVDMDSSVMIPYMKLEPKANLAAFIKEQAAFNKLVEDIKAQFEVNTKEDFAANIKDQVEQQRPAKTTEGKIKSILDEVVNEIIEDGAASQTVCLDPSGIKVYEILFSSVFYKKANMLGFKESVEYKHEYTAYILSELATYLVEEEGFKLSFEVVEDKVVAGLA
ncbi:hypothetical protein [Bacillus mycoides]|uniref:Uncharacterized protein n=1 Tax=Bacillus mycoides (strain KBAB4) TaxID=315730 RepID=A9VUU8_BACMK|nr:hypothetical protein [Bacillus mycoides]ABY46669.1 hypothetical protein BcerKBAB4_5714 [Bacillus mycoides KBAB4]